MIINWEGGSNICFSKHLQGLASLIVSRFVFLIKSDGYGFFHAFFMSMYLFMIAFIKGEQLCRYATKMYQWLKALEDGRIHKHGTQVKCRDGRAADYACTASVALRDDDGNPTAVIEVSRDITERKEKEKGLAESLAEMERVNRLMTGQEERVIEMNREVNSQTQQLLGKHTASLAQFSVC